MTEILVAEEHIQVYDVWRERGVRDLEVCHIDFHCDMRGLLLDRRRGRAWVIDGSDPRIAEPDSGNFMAHAIMQGMVRSLRWVHDPFGGRRYDTGTVKFETDLTAQPHRLLHRLRGEREVAIDFEETTFERWDGLRPGEHFDIDWDGLAAIDYDVPHIKRLMREVLDREYPSKPKTIYLVYSPGYSHPDKSLFDEFLSGLERKFAARIERLPAYQGPPHRAEAASLIEGVEKRVVLGLRRLGLY